jgi:predicted transcriptional regulator
MKVTLPYKVAKAIKNIKDRRDGERTLFNYPAIANHAVKNEDYNDINVYINQNEENFKNYYNALLNGFEIEKTPHEKVKERYMHYLNNNLHVSANAIKETLDLLGIHIEEVND